MCCNKAFKAIKMNGIRCISKELKFNKRVFIISLHENIYTLAIFIHDWLSEITKHKTNKCNI